MRLVVGTFTEASKRILFNLYRKAGVDSSELTFDYDPLEVEFLRIDLFGEQALYQLTGKKGIDNWRGSSLPLIGETELRCMPTYDPQWLMANQWAFPTVISDLKKSLAQPPEFYNLNPSLEDVRNFTATTFSMDIETGYPKHDNITVVGLCERPFHAMCIPFQEPFISELRRIMLNAKNIIGHNLIQFDMPRLCEALELEW